MSGSQAMGALRISVNSTFKPRAMARCAGLGGISVKEDS